MSDRSFSIDLKVGEALVINGGRAVLTVLEKSGQRIRLGFLAPASVKVHKAKKAQAGADQAKFGLTV